MWFLESGCSVFVTLIMLGLTLIVKAQLDDELDFGGIVGIEQAGLADYSSVGQGPLLQQEYTFPVATSSSFGGGASVLGGNGRGLRGIAASLLGTNIRSIGIPTQESITQLGHAIVDEGGIPSGVNGEVSSPTPQPPPRGQERRVGIVKRLLSAGFLKRR